MVQEPPSELAKARARGLRGILWLGVIIAPARLLLGLAEGLTWAVGLSCLVILVASSAGLLLARRSLTSAAAWCVSTAVLLDMVILAWADGGVMSPAMLGFLALIAFAALFLGRADVGVFATITVVVVVMLEVARHAGLLPANAATPANWAIALISYAIPLAGILTITTTETRRALDRLRNSTERLQASIAAEVEFRTRVEHQVREHAVMAAIASQALGNDVGALLRFAAQQIAEVVDVPLVTVHVCGSEGWGLAAADGHGPSTPALPPTSTLTSICLDAGAPADLDAVVASHPELADHPIVRAGLLRCCHVPIGDRNAPAAVLAVFALPPHTFSADDHRFLTSVAGLLGAILLRFRSEQALRETEQRLAHADRMDAVGRLAGGVAHDFNNLITTVLGHAELLRPHPGLDDEARTDVEGIAVAARQAGTLTRQLLAFSRKQVLRPQQVDVNVVIAEHEHMMRRVIGRGIEVHTTCEPSLPPIEVDVTQLQQVLMNLTVNARDAMPDGGRLEFVTERQGNDVVIQVRDTGTGIPADVLPHIFEPFFTTKTEGSGLGLATVYGILQQSGGRIAVDSGPAGTTMRLSFPACAGSERECDEHQGRPAPTRRALRVLAIDDDPQMLRVALRALTRAGHDVVAVTTADEAVRIYDDSFDVVVSDVVMPGMQGPEFIQYVRAHGGRSRLILMSGYISEDRDAAGIADAFLEKPFAPAALCEAVAATSLFNTSRTGRSSNRISASA